MSQKNGRKISKRSVKHNFTTIGLMLVLYVLIVMIVPYFMHMYMLETNSFILKDDLLYYGIYFLIIVLGTVIPFFIMRLFCKRKVKQIFRKVDATFVDLFVQTIVFFTVCVALTYVSNMVFSRFGLEGKLISSIGFNYDSSNLSNPLYVFMLLLVCPLIEEYAFRGVLLSCLSRYSKTFALYATSLIFAFAHSNFAEILPAFAMGIALGKTSLRYRSIQPTIVIHILFNAFIYILCVMPAKIAGYMAYGLVAICILAIYLYLTGRYERISIQKTKSSGITTRLFFTRFTVLFALLLMIAYTCFLTFIG